MEHSSTPRRTHHDQLQRTVQLQQAHHAAAASSSPAQAAKASPRPSAGMSSPPFESHLDRSNPLILRVLEMARVLGIDATQEFYLLPIALHALAAPDDWDLHAPSTAAQPSPSAAAQPSSSAAAVQPPESSTQSWFLSLVSKERARFQKSPTENSPWVKITAPTRPPPPRLTDDPTAPLPALPAVPPSGPAPFWFNFRTFRRASTQPPTASAGSRSREDEQLLLHGSPHLSRRAAASVRLPPLRRIGAGLDLEVMQFTSWFTERSHSGPDASGTSEHRGCSASGGAARGSKRYIHIRYYLAREEFEVEIMPSSSTSAASMAGDVPPQPSRLYHLKSLHTTKHGGGVASCWDLHLKATLDLFGRPTTLLQCDSATREWLEQNARRLMAVRTLLETKLSKFEKISSTHSASAAQTNVPLVEVHLRSVMKDVARLKAKLATYRPGLAEKYKL